MLKTHINITIDEDLYFELKDQENLSAYINNIIKTYRKEETLEGLNKQIEQKEEEILSLEKKRIKIFQEKLKQQQKIEAEEKEIINKIELEKQKRFDAIKEILDKIPLLHKEFLKEFRENPEIISQNGFLQKYTMAYLKEGLKVGGYDLKKYLREVKHE